jgi:hypothetical protein
MSATTRRAGNSGPDPSFSAVSSKLARDSQGRLVVVVTAVSEPGLSVGQRFVVLGNDLPCSASGFDWLGKHTGHPATVDERVEAETGHGSPRLPANDAGFSRLTH